MSLDMPGDDESAKAKIKVRSEIAEECSLEWQSNNMLALNSAMTKHGISEPATRRAIIEDALWSVASELDGSSGGAFIGDEEYFPVLCWVSVGEGSAVIHCSRQFALHEQFHFALADVLKKSPA